ncbi:MAG: phage holin family protein [Bacteroidota bacterium]
METIIELFIHALAFYLGAQLLSGIQLKGFLPAILLAVAIALLNITLGTVLKIVSLGILTMGLFTLVLDAILIKVADYFITDFKVKNFWWALALAAVVAVIDGVLGKIL